MPMTIRRIMAAVCLCAGTLPAAAAPPPALCALVTKSFADALAGPATAKPVGTKTCRVSVGGFADFWVGVNVSLNPGSAAALGTMRKLLTTPSTAEPSLGAGAYSILDAGGNGMLPQFTLNAAKSGTWVIIEIRRKAGFTPADLAKARADAKALLATL